MFTYGASIFQWYKNAINPIENSVQLSNLKTKLVNAFIWCYVYLHNNFGPQQNWDRTSQLFIDTDSFYHCYQLKYIIAAFHKGQHKQTSTFWKIFPLLEEGTQSNLQFFNFLESVRSTNIGNLKEF